MNAFQTERYDLSYSDKSPILIAASSDAALARAVGTIEAAGCRIGDRLTLDVARGRMEQQVAASAVWLELDRDCGTEMDDILAFIDKNAADGRFGAVVSASPDLIDVVAARIDGAAVELIVEADEAQRIGALALASARAGMGNRLSDIASDQNAERLRQLSDEVGRIAATLARLSSGPAAPPRTFDAGPSDAVPELSAETVRTVIRARRLRSRFFSEHLFADPAWDMLLDLLQAEIAQLRVPVSSLCIAAAVPATTALRWLKTMVQDGIFVRRADPHDGRRVFVELAPEASRALRRYFAEVGRPATI
ncbi:MAG TPA: MarR family winged helix-turn-helix transcriptional regulator [Sphingomicrobium sp.]